jgi:hypothetical protein
MCFWVVLSNKGKEGEGVRMSQEKEPKKSNILDYEIIGERFVQMVQGKLGIAKTHIATAKRIIFNLLEDKTDEVLFQEGNLKTKFFDDLNKVCSDCTAIIELINEIEKILFSK